jgi:virulence-associated protein VagC
VSDSRRHEARAGRAQRSAGSRRAKVFWSGRSQAVRLPKEFRFATAEVAIYREGNRVVLEPVAVERDANGWPLAWWQLAGAAPAFGVGKRSARHERGNVLKSRS